MLALSAAQGLLSAAIAMSTLTLGTSTIFGLANTIVQERAPDYIRGRVSPSRNEFLRVLPSRASSRPPWQIASACAKRSPARRCATARAPPSSLPANVRRKTVEIDRAAAANDAA